MLGSPASLRDSIDTPALLGSAIENLHEAAKRSIVGFASSNDRVAYGKPIATTSEKNKTSPNTLRTVTALIASICEGNHAHRGPMDSSVVDESTRRMAQRNVNLVQRLMAISLKTTLSRAGEGKKGEHYECAGGSHSVSA